MEKKKGLQRFTKFEQNKKSLWNLKQITHEAMNILTNDEKDKFLEEVNAKLAIVKGAERDTLLKQFEPIFNNETKNQCWEYNHSHITIAIATLMQENGRMPSKVELANKTGLSRPTIDKHLKEYSSNPLYIQEVEQFKFMTAKVLAKVFKFAVNGDIRACKLYLEFMGNANGQPSNNTLIQNQNNYIQINGRVLSQETIKHLNPEQLNTIETILKTALPQPEISKAEIIK
jgi:hypothetical protein